MKLLNNSNLLLAIDVGDTNTVFCLFEGEEIIAKLKLSTMKERTVDEYIVFLSSFFATNGISVDMISYSVVCNGVPVIEQSLKETCYRFLGNEPLVVGNSNTYLGIEIYKTKIKQEVSANIIANCVGAKEKYGRDLLVINFDMVTVFSVVDQHGIYIGSSIVPGWKSLLNSLFSNIKALPEIEIKNPSYALGENVEQAVETGVYWGYIGLVKEIIQKISKTHGKKKVIATGNISLFLKEFNDVINYFEPDLSLIGLQKIFRLNNDYKVAQYAN